MNDQSDPSGKVKVIDRRWFTEDGSLREDRLASNDEGSAAPEGPAESSDGADRASNEDRADGVDNAAGSGREGARARGQSPASTSPFFLELVSLLAQQAQMMLAGAPGVPQRADQAFRMIEYLVALEEKTQGNLSAEESQTLSNIVFELRSLAARSAGSSG